MNERRTLNLSAGVGAPAQARAFVTQHVSHLPAQLYGDAQLLVSEIVTNAVVHGQPEIVLHVESDAVTIRVTVDDQGAVFERSTAAPEELTAATSRGLSIVECYAHQWGITANPEVPGKSVWFVLEAVPTRNRAHQPAHPEVGPHDAPEESR